MRTTTYSSILEGIARLFGDAALTADDITFVSAAIDTEHLAFAWTYADWPELETIEQRFFAPDYDDAATYAADDLVYYPTTELYYTATGATTGNLPTDTDYWAEATDYPRIIPDVQAGKTPVGTLAAATLHDPRLFPGSAPLPTLSRDGGSQIVCPQQTHVWLRFTRREPRITGTAYSGSTTYAEGDLVYDATTGQCYESLADANTGNAVTDTASWQLQAIPHFLRAFLIRAALATLYESKDKEERTARNEALALDKLAAAYHTKNREGQYTRATHVNTPAPGYEAAITNQT